MHPLVSIITVTKNCDSTIERTLQSIKAIKTPDIQYIIIDGKSVDGTLATIARYEHLIDFLISEEDTGIYNAMNKGIEQATGRYILFINGDDELIPDAFLEAKKILTNTKADMLCCSSHIGSNGGLAETLIPQPNRLFFYNSVPHPSTFVLTATLKKFGFREDLKIAADYDLFLRLLIAGKKFVVADLVTAIHHRGGLSSDSEVSHSEIELIKQQRLGAIYIFVAAMQWLYRLKKKLIS
jgi:glycosyltransferase involved in cell wall biosynthesis